jgi:hypothetical protein
MRPNPVVGETARAVVPRGYGNLSPECQDGERRLVLPRAPSRSLLTSPAHQRSHRNHGNWDA